MLLLFTHGGLGLSQSLQMVYKAERIAIRSTYKPKNILFSVLNSLYGPTISTNCLIVLHSVLVNFQIT